MNHSFIELYFIFHYFFMYINLLSFLLHSGAVFNNIHYKDLYKWYSCMQIGPCNGWMTSNVTLREITTKVQ